MPVVAVDSNLRDPAQRCGLSRKTYRARLDIPIGDIYT
jgi:hypothetical protein